MAEYIECRRCDSPYCDGCNNYILSKMLHNGKFNCIMDNHTINPTADVVEARHGEWIMRTNSDGNLNHYECSVCHMQQGYLSNYCEDCGTKMDRKVQSLANKKYPRCSKCLYELTCTKWKDVEGKCPHYKRDATDGGYYG
jgi:hypothetical protein